LVNKARLAARRVLWPDGILRSGVLTFAGESIVSLERPGPHERVPDLVVAPGFVDLQVNGACGLSVASLDGWDAILSALASRGTTSFCPTLISGPLDAYRAWFARHLPLPSAAVGVHLEGPFLGARVGAHPSDHVVPVDLEFLAGLPADVRIVTLAPEADPGLRATTVLAERGVVVSLGHSGADAATARAAVGAGARLVTHVFNAMEPLGHRSPGLAGVALTDDRLTVGLIADGVHVDPAVIVLVFRAKPPGAVALVSDSAAEGGRRADGTLAGSAYGLDHGVRTAVGAGVPLAAALLAATLTPARVLRLSDRGSLVAGGRADAVVLSPGLDILETWSGGQRRWTAE